MKNLYLFIATVLFSSILSAQKVVILKNLAPGDQDGLKLSSQIITFNGKTYFSGNNGSFGYYLYETDGTAKGTKRVSDNITGVENFTVSGNALYFYGYADDTPSGYTLFRFSETNVISKVKAISDIIHIIPFGKAGALFTKKNLSGTFELWKTDSTAASNILLGTFDFDLYSTYFSTFNNSVIISEKSSNSNQFESIITDGTLAGTKKLKDFLAPAIIFEKIGSVTSVKDKIFVEGRVKDIGIYI